MKQVHLVVADDGEPGLCIDSIWSTPAKAAQRAATLNAQSGFTDWYVSKWDVNPKITEKK